MCTYWTSPNLFELYGEGGGEKIMETWKMLTVKVKAFLACFGHISIKIRLEMNRERSY